jgi:hypothetical protein
VVAKPFLVMGGKVDEVEFPHRMSITRRLNESK